MSLLILLYAPHYLLSLLFSRLQARYLLSQSLFLMAQRGFAFDACLMPLHTCLPPYAAQRHALLRFAARFDVALLPLSTPL